MPPAAAAEPLLRAVAWTLASLFVLCAGTALGLAWLRERSARADAPLLHQGRRILARGLVNRALEPADEIFLRKLSPGRLVKLFVELAPTLAGDSRTELRRLGDELGVQREGERLTRSPFWWRRLRGARVLTAVGGGDEAIRALAGDPRPAVRAQCAEWIAEHVPDDAAPRLEALLLDPEPVVRFAAKEGLHQLGARAVEQIARLLAAPDPAVREAALDVAVGRPLPEFQVAALRLARDPSPHVRAGAAALLARIGGSRAAGPLAALSRDPDPEVREAATRGLGHLADLSAAPHLTRRLDDPAWNVRRSAGLALRSLGAAGEILLRRTSRRDDRAGAVARLVLAEAAPPEGRTP